MTQDRPVLDFTRRPSVLAYMARAFVPSPGLERSGGFPPLTARWRNMRIDRRHWTTFREITGLQTVRGLPILYPHVFSFPLVMALLTHPAFPLPIWNALQIRNHLRQYRAIMPDESFDLESRVADQRILKKGAEADFRTTLHAGGELVWESLNTFYYRGRHGPPGEASPLAAAPTVDGDIRAIWHLPSGSGLRFGRLTGDYNGIHYARRYARLFGFPGAFHHPPSVIGQAMARLAAPTSDAQGLDAWLKGPVFYDVDVELSATGNPDNQHFAIAMMDDRRPAIVGRWWAA